MATVAWSYRYVNMNPELKHGVSTEYPYQVVQRLGDEGWELVSVDGGMAYLKKLSRVTRKRKKNPRR